MCKPALSNQREMEGLLKPDTVDPLFVSLFGLIGAGKTTLAKALAKELNVQFYGEPVEKNPYLERFYADMGANGFPMQIWLLTARFAQHLQMTWTGGVQDRSIYEDQVFARALVQMGHIRPLDYDTYVRAFKIMQNQMKNPHFLVYLDIKPETALARIRSRGRKCEAGITLDYLKRLHAGYETLVKEISKTITVFRVPYEKFKSGEEMARTVKERWDAVSHVQDVVME